MESDVTRNIEEQLSAFLDGELAAEELQLLVRRLERDGSYRATLARYSAIGSALRNDQVLPASGDFRTGIMAAISADTATSVVADQPAAPARKRNNSLLAAGFAAVAVAVVWQLGFVDISTSDPVSIAEPQLSATITPPAAAVASTDTATSVRTKAPLRGRINPERMTSYMMSHGEFSRTIHGPMANSRIFVQQASFSE